jgi:hypothetical protein
VGDGQKGTSPSVWGDGHFGWHLPWLAYLLGHMSAWAQWAGREEREGQSGEQGKGKGHHGFKAACPGGKPLDTGTST